MSPAYYLVIMEEHQQPQPSFINPAPTPAPVPDPSHPEHPASTGIMAELFAFILETLRVVVVSLVIILPIRYFVLQPFFVSGSSMVPNFYDKEYVLIEKWSYRLGVPARGDVIVFRYPNNPKEYFIKRILGLPGETVVAGLDNSVKVYNTKYPDGFTVYEKHYLPDSHPTNCYSGTSSKYCGTRVTLGPDEYYLMGDNREHSSDSRSFGPVHKSFFAGMAWLRLFPFDQIGLIPRTEYPPIVQ